ncbi:hypothetical protein F4808DRAFT_464058 [Astrocystis sublimbata]|nr:hypothetical protein F4808DRAFT_464058 [Astrocystis sublimbata]
MALLTEVILAVQEGFIMAVTHFALRWFLCGWTRVLGNIVVLTTYYSLFFYAVNTFFYISHQQAVDVPAAPSWLVSFSRFASDVFRPTLTLEAVIHMLTPWIPATWSVSSLLLGLLQVYSAIFHVVIAMPRQTINNAIAFFAQPHVMQRVHQITTTIAAAWFIIRHIASFLYPTTPPAPLLITDTPSPAQQLITGSDEQQHIYWAVREIVANCDTHWRMYFTWGCKLERGAPPAQLRKLERLVESELPDDYKTFLLFTNGLKNVLDGGKPHLTFLAADSPKFADSATYNHPGMATRHLYTKWLVDALFGPDSFHALQEQTGHRDKPGQDTIRLIKIASRQNELGGVYLVSAEDMRNVARDWLEVALSHPGRNGALIGTIYHHTGAYFGNCDYLLETLRYWQDWLVLQVELGPQTPHCRLYPGFTAFLQTLAEVTRRATDKLMNLGLDEKYYADHCRYKWEWEWTRGYGGETRRIGSDVLGG